MPSALVLIDWENIMINIKDVGYKPEGFSRKAGIDRLLKWIKTEAETIFDIFVFIPLHIVYTDFEMLHEQGFTIVVCPKVPLGAEDKKDTTDAGLKKLGEKWITHQGLTHLCLVSGDGDFAPLAEEAKNKGLNIMISAASEKSLSSRLRDLADISPVTGQKMIHIFSPTI
jgi:hypothetical protein